MKRIGLANLVLGSWRKYVTLGVLAVVVVLFVDAVAGRDVHLWWKLQSLSGAPAETVDEIRLLGHPYRGALARAVLRGGRRFDAQLALSNLALQDPFYLRAAIREAMEDDDPVIRRAAAVAVLRQQVSARRGAFPDGALAVLAEWAEHPADAWLDVGLRELTRYEDPRLVDPLVDLLLARSEEGADSLEDIGRANENRAAAALLLRRYVADPRVAEALREVVYRERESDDVQIRSAQALAAGGFSEEVKVYEHLAASENPVIRQVVADNLESVKDPRVVPILEKLLEDSKETVRRGAVNSLMKKRAPKLMEELWYLAEDQFDSIKGDLAMAVGLYRRSDLVPYLAWCLQSVDPRVVEKAYVELARLTGSHHGLTDAQWEEYGNPRTPWPEKDRIIRDLMNDEERKERAVVAWTEEYPPRYGDPDRVPHLIRQLGHADAENVRRAARELVRITGRRAGLPPETLVPKPEVQKESDQVFRFMNEERDEVIADWARWLEKDWPDERRRLESKREGD